MTKTNNEPMMYRQGDVLITRVDRLPELATELPRDEAQGVVLAKGGAIRSCDLCRSGRIAACRESDDPRRR